MQLILQTANVTADAKNCSYPNKVTVTNASELQEAVKMDHVCAEYKNNYRSIDNFLKSNVVVMDLDNDHTDDPDEWITAEKLEELLPDISYAVAPSRNHMVAKNGKAARPKYHVYFEIEEITDSAEYAALKAAIHFLMVMLWMQQDSFSELIVVKQFGTRDGQLLMKKSWLNFLMRKQHLAAVRF